MNAKTFQLFTFSLFAVLLSSIMPQSKAQAADDVLVETVVVTDEWVVRSQAFHCGTSADTSIACQDELRACEIGIDKIMDNAHRVCYQRPSECWIIDVTATGFTRSAYNLLVGDPIDFYANSAEVAAIKNCRNQHPKSEDNAPKPTPPKPVADPDFEDRLARERGRVEAEQAPVDANANPVDAKGLPEVDTNNKAATTGSAEQGSDLATVGCSLQLTKYPTTALQGFFAMLLVLIPFLMRKAKNIITLGLFVVFLGSFAPLSKAHAIELGLPIRVIHDDDVERDQVRLCGKEEETSNACQDKYRACVAGIREITDNLYRVCIRRPKDCSVDVVQYTLPGEMADLAYDAPIESFALGAEVFNLNSCRAQHPKSEDNAPKAPTPPQSVTDPALEDRRAAERARAREAGEPVEANTDPVEINADPVAGNAEPKAMGNKKDVSTTGPTASAEKDTEVTFGCSLQTPKSPTTAWQGFFAILLVLSFIFFQLPFSLFQRSASDKSRKS